MLTWRQSAARARLWAIFIARDLGLKITRAKDYRVFIPRITSIPRISQLMFSIYSTEHHDKNTQNKRNRTHQLCLARLHSLSVQLCSIWVYATL